MLQFRDVMMSRSKKEEVSSEGISFDWIGRCAALISIYQDTSMHDLLSLAQKHNIIAFDYDSRQIHRFDGHVGVKLEFEGLEAIYAPNDEYLRQSLDKLKPKSGASFMIVETRDQYLQIGGGPKKFTVECRENTSSNDYFRHFVAFDNDEKSVKNCVIYGNGTVFRVRKNEILTRAQVQAILVAFVDQRRRPIEFHWRDISETLGAVVSPQPR